MAAKVRQAPVYAMWQDPIRPKIRQTPVFVMVIEPSMLPKNTAGPSAIARLVSEGAKTPILPGDISIGPPEVTTEYNCNTRILITALEKNSLNAEGSMYLYYNRAAVSRIDLPVNWTIAGTDTSTATALARLVTASGMALTMDDFVNNQLVGTSLKLEGAATSYFFIPGSFITLTKP